MREMRHVGNFRFGLVCLAFLLLGGLLRYETGWLHMPWDEHNRVPTMPAGLVDTIARFYEALDRGQYDQAAGLSLENKWSGFGQGVYISQGLVTPADFANEIGRELGPHGEDLTVVTLDFLSAAPLPAAERSVSAYPELAALAALPPENIAEEVYQVEIAGSMLGPCSRLEWRKHLLVVRLTGLGWRVLLPGSSGPGCKRVEQWFQDKNYFAGKQLIQEMRLR